MTRSPRRLVAAAGALALPALAGLALATPSQAAGTATVSVLHAVPGLTVDVYANGRPLLKNFRPGTLAGPLTLPASTYDLTVFKAGANPKTAKPAIEANHVAVPAGVNATITANLTAAGKPALNVFVNDTSRIPAGMARVIVRHVAAAPAVDVRAGGKPVFRGLTNPHQAVAEVPAGTLRADVVLAGTSTVAIGPASLTAAEGTDTIVYAWGSAAGKSLKLAVQTIGGLSSAPGGMQSGSGGLADQTPPWVPAGMALSLVGASAAALVLTRRRRTAG